MWFLQIAQLSTTISAQVNDFWETRNIQTHYAAYLYKKLKKLKLGFESTPSPESDSIPLLDLKSLRFFGRGRASTTRSLTGGNHRHIGIQRSHGWNLDRSVSVLRSAAEKKSDEWKKICWKIEIKKNDLRKRKRSRILIELFQKPLVCLGLLFIWATKTDLWKKGPWFS